MGFKNIFDVLLATLDFKGNILRRSFVSRIIRIYHYIKFEDFQKKTKFQLSSFNIEQFYMSYAKLNFI